jgi:hypothetical protein
VRPICCLLASLLGQRQAPEAREPCSILSVMGLCDLVPWPGSPAVSPWGR